MADAQRTIDLIFNGVDKTGAATLAAVRNVEGFASNVQRLTGPLASATEWTVKLEAAILASGVALAVFAVREAAKFETAVLDLQKVLSDSDGDIKQFEQAAADLAQQFGVSATDVLASVSNFKQAGFTALEAVQLARDALNLKIAGDLEAAQASELLVASLKGFELQAGSATRVVDLLNEVSNRYATNVSELGIGFARLSPVAKAAGLSLEETAGLLTPGIEVFRSGSEVANGLRTVLLRLQDDSKPVGEALATIGVKQRDVNGDLRSARDIYFDVAKAFQTLEPNQRTFIAQQLAGIEQSAKFIAITGGLSKTLEIAGSNFAYAGSAVREVEIRLKSAEVQAARATESFSALLRSIGAPLLDEFGGIAGAVSNIFAALATSVQSNSQLGGVVAYVEKLFGDLQATLETVARNLPAALAKADFGGFTRGIDAVIGAFARLFGGIDLSTVDGLTRAIELAGTAFLGLSRFTAGVIDSFKPLVDLIVRMGSDLGKADTAWLEFAGNIGGAVTQINFVLGAIGGLVPAVEVLVGLMVANNALSLLSAVRTVAGALPALGAAFGVAGAAFAGAFAVEKLYQVVSGLLQLKEAQENLAQAQERARIETERGADTIARFVETTGLAVNSVDEAMALVDAGKVVWSEAANGWVQVGSAMDTAAQSADGVVDPFGEANRKMIEAADAAAAAEDAAGGLTKAQKDVAAYTMKVVEIIDSATGKVIGYEQQLVRTEGSGRRLGAATQDVAKELKTSGDVMEQLGRKTDLTNKELIELAKNVRDAEIRLEEIASNERIKFFEAKVALDVADIEAGTKRIEAAFSSINTTIDSTGSVLGGLFALFKDENSLSWRAMSEIRDQIEQENKLRREAFELQKKLTEEQIREMQARTRRMEQGDAIIKISGDGLKPHLEAMMWEVFKAVQVRVNQQGLSMLMGA